MTLTEAAIAGISRIRRPIWRNTNVYVKLDLIENGSMGPWVHLYDRTMQQFFDAPTPQTMLAINDTTSDYEEYKGQLDKEDKNA